MRAIALLLLAACGGKTAMPEYDQRRLEAALATVDARAAVYLDDRTRGLREAMAHPPELGGPCTFALPPTAALVSHSSLLPGWALSGTPPPAISSPEEAQWARLGLEGLPHSMFAKTRTYFAEQIAARQYAKHETLERMLSRIELLAGPAVWGYELVIVTDHWDTAVHGQAYLWSYDERRVRCAGPVEGPFAVVLDAARLNLRDAPRK